MSPKCRENCERQEKILLRFRVVGKGWRGKIWSQRIHFPQATELTENTQSITEEKLKTGEQRKASPFILLLLSVMLCVFSVNSVA